MSFDKWETYTLNEVCSKITDGAHFSPVEDSNGSHIIATVKDMDEYTFKYSSCKKISKAKYDELVKGGCKPEKGDVLFSKDGTIGIVQLFKDDIDLVLLSSIAILKPNKEMVYPGFLKYFLFNPLTSNSIKENFKSGSALPRVTLKDLKRVPISLPNLNLQRRIAAVLSSLDDKIELNRQTNQTLEAIAQTLFKEWFVNFNFPGATGEKHDSAFGEIPKGWRVEKLDSIIKLIIDHRGKTPLKLNGNWSEHGISAISAKNVKDGKITNLNSVNFVDDNLYRKWMKEPLKPYDILLTSEAPLGELAIVIDDTKYCLSQRLFAIRTDSDYKQIYLYHYLMSKQGQDNIQRRASGSTVQGIRQSELRLVEIIIPDTYTLSSFHAVVEPILHKLKNNEEQIQTLTQFRDTLLPKLMKGEIAITEAEPLIAAAL